MGAYLHQSMRRSFVEYLMSCNLNILSQGNEPTFVVLSKQGVTYLTLGTNKIENLVSNWHVSNELSLSDHHYLCF
jgi:hypothetical protein